VHVGTVTLGSMIGARIRRERLAREWTLVRLADTAGVSHRKLVNTEQGEVNPSIGTLMSMGGALGIALSRTKPAKHCWLQLKRRLAPRSGTGQGGLPHVAACRDAYRTFGTKPQRTRNGLEALVRRAEIGLPRVNLLTATYNATPGAALRRGHDCLSSLRSATRRCCIACRGGAELRPGDEHPTLVRPRSYD